VNPIERLHALIHRKRAAYQHTFLVDGKPGPLAATVLADLKRYCGADREGLVVSPVTRTADPVATAYRAGRRDVYLRICKFLSLDGLDIEDNDDHDNRADTAKR
jgi:hypothetical protein